MAQSDTWWPRINAASPVPLYVQIVQSVAFAIASGELTPGDALPSVRSLAAGLCINPNTAARSIREMEVNRLSRPVRGVGSVVADEAREAAASLASSALLRELDATIEIARSLSFDLDETLKSLSERWKETRKCDTTASSRATRVSKLKG